MNIVLFGIQGSGKGTHAALLTEKLPLQHFNLGEVFREEIKANSELGNEVKEFIDEGHLVPDETVFHVIENHIKITNDNEGFIFDGFPRTLNQAKYLVEHYEIDQVIYLDLSDEEAKERIMSRVACSKCGAGYNLLFSPPKVAGICDLCGGKVTTRKDDNPKAVDVRIKKFHQKTKELTDFFAERGLLHNITANEPIDVIHNKILDIIKGNK